jgi:signal peptidase II
VKQAVPLNRYLVYFAIALGGCAVDLAGKTWMFEHLGMPGPDSRTWWLWQDVFGFQTSLNEGALFGMGQGFSWLFAALSVGALLGVLLWLFAAGAAADWLLTVALAIVSIGILGNLYDRLGMPGLVWNGANPHHLPGERVYAVRDFILVMIGRWPWPTFNIADSSLVCGAVLLLGHALFAKTDDPSNEPAAGGEVND